MILKKIWIFWFLLFSVISFSFAQDSIIRLHFIDVGYGDAILLELADGRSVLIDSGGQEHAGHLKQYLTSRNIKNLDACILTHPHKNHFGGLLSLIKEHAIRKIYTNGDVAPDEEGYDDLIKAIEASRIPTIVLREKDELLLGDAQTRLFVLHPPALSGTVNENALVLWLIHKDTAFLLVSDIQESQQIKLLEHYPEVRESDVIQIPHHGGKMAKQFTGAFRRNAIFVLSTGINQYGKPFAEELNKLRGQLLRTDREGAIVLRSDGHRVEVSHE